MAAIKQIVGNSPPDQHLIRQKLFASLDRDAMKPDDRAVLAWMTGKDLKA
jgi:hypothetical protein